MLRTPSRAVARKEQKVPPPPPRTSPQLIPGHGNNDQKVADSNKKKKSRRRAARNATRCPISPPLMDGKVSIVALKRRNRINFHILLTSNGSELLGRMHPHLVLQVLYQTFKIIDPKRCSKRPVKTKSKATAFTRQIRKCNERRTNRIVSLHSRPLEHVE